MCCPSAITAHALAPSAADPFLWSVSEIKEVLGMASTGFSSVSSVWTPCPGVENESAAIRAWHVLQPQGQQSLEAATLCDPRSCLSLKSKAHFLWGTVLEQSQGQALPSHMGTA